MGKRTSNEGVAEKIGCFWWLSYELKSWLDYVITFNYIHTHAGKRKSTSGWTLGIGFEFKQRDLDRSSYNLWALISFHGSACSVLAQDLIFLKEMGTELTLKSTGRKRNSHIVSQNYKWALQLFTFQFFRHSIKTQRLWSLCHLILLDFKLSKPVWCSYFMTLFI